MNKATAWRNKKKGIPADHANPYARLQSFDFESVFHELDWYGTPIQYIRKKTEFVNFAKAVAAGEPPYTVAARMELSENTVYMWIERLLLLIEQSK